MNEDYREFEANELLRISIAKQEAFDAAVRKRRERVAAWNAEDNQLLDDISAALRAADKVGWHHAGRIEQPTHGGKQNDSSRL